MGEQVEMIDAIDKIAEMYVDVDNMINEVDLLMKKCEEEQE